MNNADKELSMKEQKRAFADAGRIAANNNPAADNIFGSRSFVIIHRNFDIAYEKAGISRQPE